MRTELDERMRRRFRGFRPAYLWELAELRCLNGIVLGGGAVVGCGQCMACRINRRRTWSARIELEAMTYEHSSFVTLTYDEPHYPSTGLSKVHWREFTKDVGYRYFGCGEYGSVRGRGHYHIILFGAQSWRATEFVADRWRYGFIDVKDYCAGHAQYIAQYVAKKMTKPDDARLLPGQIPEFAIMSRRPAVGTPGIRWIDEWLSTPEGRRHLASTGDVPPVVRIGGSLFPLGRTLVRKLRERHGIALSDPSRLRALAERQLQEASDPKLQAFLEKKRERSRQQLFARANRARGVL